jgi:hypothetical protein
MTSIFQRALGADFDRLHPEIQARFGFSSTDGIASIGTGVMDRIWRRPGFTRPFLVLGTRRRIMFPEQGSDIPFTIENWAYLDGLGRETVTFNRTFELPKRTRRFDATMIYSEQRGTVVDYLGTHQHLAADVSLRATDGGALELTTGQQRFYERAVGFRFPMLFSGKGTVREWFDDHDGRHHIDVNIANDHFGKLFGYTGSFTVERRAVPPTGVPSTAKPIREEARE